MVVMLAFRWRWTNKKNLNGREKFEKTPLNGANVLELANRYAISRPPGNHRIRLRMSRMVAGLPDVLALSTTNRAGAAVRSMRH
jgi:hypothetical protein